MTLKKIVSIGLILFTLFILNGCLWNDFWDGVEKSPLGALDRAINKSAKRDVCREQYEKCLTTRIPKAECEAGYDRCKNN